MTVFNTEVEHKISNIGDHLLDTGQHVRKKTMAKFFFHKNGGCNISEEFGKLIREQMWQDPKLKIYAADSFCSKPAGLESLY